MEQMTVPQGTFELSRYPIRSNDQLRAWDAADELLLQFLAGEFTPRPDDNDPVSPPATLVGTTVVVNDAFGALAVPLAASGSTDHIVSYGDSYTSYAGARANLAANSVDPSRVEFVGSLGVLPERIDTLLIKLPKSLDLLVAQLCRLAPLIHEETVVVGSAMAKHVHRSGLEAFEAAVGATRTSLAKKKARLILATPGSGTASTDGTASAEGALPAESLGVQNYRIDPGGLKVTSFPGVFSSERLDVGTSFLLDNLPDQAGQIRIVDLGCGNGVVGLVAMVDNPDAELIFVDDSYFAVASARATVRDNLGSATGAEFIVGSGLEDLAERGPIERGSVDLIFNNPPFHLDNALSDATAWQMFTESHRALRKGGQLWVIGNRHLAYHAKLKRIFGNCDVIDANPKFVVYRSTRS